MIAVFVSAKNEEEALNYCQNALIPIKSFFSIFNVRSSEKYWKIKGIFLVEFDLEYNHNLNNDPSWLNALNLIGEGWKIFGDPPDEFLISKTMNGSRIKDERIEMIDITLWEENRT